MAQHRLDAPVAKAEIVFLASDFVREALEFDEASTLCSGNAAGDVIELAHVFFAKLIGIEVKSNRGLSAILYLSRLAIRPSTCSASVSIWFTDRRALSRAASARRS